MTPPQATVTQLLEELKKGRKPAFDALYALVYDELRARAHRQRQNWHGDYTLDSVALVNGAYEKLVDQSRADWTSRAHFLAVAAKVMRNLLIDYARKRRAKIHGGDWQKLSFDEVKALLEKERGGLKEPGEMLEVLEEALQRLAQVDERQSQVVECRFFGMAIEETAAALGIATATVNRDWKMARAWLYREIKQLMQG